jgi:Peptidase A4 family
MKTSLTILITVLALVTTNLAAQSPAYVIQTDLPGVAAAVEPPAWLDPLTATDADLATYGFPPRPDAETQPRRFRSWQRAMARPKHFIVPQLTITNRVHGLARGARAQEMIVPGQISPTPPQPTGITTSWTSSNWSAVVVRSGASSFGTDSFHTVSAEYVVPQAPQPSGSLAGAFNINCPATQSSSWVGIDGWSQSAVTNQPAVISQDVLQAGTESDASCQSQNYYAWYEWYSDETGKSQGPEVQIGGFAVSPGDDIWIEVWNTSATQGYAFIFNYATGEAVNLSFPAPPGTTLRGNTAEWVVERPTNLDNGSLATLADYASDYFSNSNADTYSNAVYSPGAASAELVTMLNGSVPISYPTLLGADAIQFQHEAPPTAKKAIF